MRRHRAQKHGDAVGKFKCDECRDLRFFPNKRSLTNHIRAVHTKVACPLCDAKLSPANLSRHKKKQHTVQADTFTGGVTPTNSADTDSRVSTDAMKLPTVPQLSRAPRLAPTHDETVRCLGGFWDYLRRTSSLYRRGDTSNNARDYLSKFRTFVGKFAKFHGVETAEMLNDLADPNACVRAFNKEKLTRFFEGFVMTKDRGELKASSIYNVAAQVVNFLKWQVNINNMTRLRRALELIEKLTDSVGKKRKRDHDPDMKAAYIKSLPSVPEVLKFLHGELQQRIDKIDSTTATWTAYQAYRDFVLVMMLFAVPPQRAGVFHKMETKHVLYLDGSVIIKLAQHKTSHIYGPVVIAIPPEYKRTFENFVKVRLRLAHETQSKDGKVFLNKYGQADKQLTTSFSLLMYQKFKKRINIRICRSIYITYAFEHGDFTQDDMVRLARQMCHSYEVQQQVYVSRSSTCLAIESLDMTRRLNPHLNVRKHSHTDGIRPARKNAKRALRKQRIPSRDDSSDLSEASCQSNYSRESSLFASSDSEELMLSDAE